MVNRVCRQDQKRKSLSATSFSHVSVITISCIASSATTALAADCGTTFNITANCTGAATPISGASFTNSGSISAGTVPATLSGSAGQAIDGISIQNSTSIGILTNTGSIAITSSGSLGPSVQYYGIVNQGQIGSLINTGVITAQQGGIFNQGTIQDISNSGIIDGVYAGLYNQTGSITFLNNQSLGSITGFFYGVSNQSNIDRIVNDGFIFANVNGINNDGGGTIGSIINNGTIFSNSGNGIYANGKVGDITNFGLVRGGNVGIQAETSRTINVINNNNIVWGGSVGINNVSTPISNLNNAGSIFGGVFGIANAGHIQTLSNLGTIQGATFDIDNNHGTIDVLINAQGGSGSTVSSLGSLSVLTYSGNLPSSYQEYITDTNHYGQINFTSITGTMDFSVAVGSNAKLNQTYSAVLTGITADQIGGSISTLTSCGTISSTICFTGSSMGYSWYLYQEPDHSTTWDLFFTSVVAAPELDGSLVPRAILLLFIAYLIGGGSWTLFRDRRHDQ